MRVLVATVRTPFVQGGAESLVEELIKALIAEGHEAEAVALPFNPSEPERIPDQMLGCRLLDLREIQALPVDRLIAMKFPAYLIPHPQKVFWLMHQHRAAYDMWEHPLGDLRSAPRGRAVRDIIRQGDQRIGEEARAIFTISRTVSERLRRYSEIESTPLYHPPPLAESFYTAETTGDYFFFPSRLSAAKRQELVLRALALTRAPVRVKFSGNADSPPYGKRLREQARALGVEQRVEWLGFISEEQKREAYAHARAVIFPPLDEDYGYISLEAMLAEKAVITCADSGGTLEFVRPGETGLVTAPEETALAQAMDALWQDPALAQEYGRAGRRHYDSLGLSWPQVIKKLLA